MERLAMQCAYRCSVKFGRRIDATKGLFTQVLKAKPRITQLGIVSTGPNPE